MEYQHLTQERREYIDELVGTLKQKYSTDSGIDFESMARDYDINFYQATAIYFYRDWQPKLPNNLLATQKL